MLPWLDYRDIVPQSLDEKDGDGIPDTIVCLVLM